MADFSTTAELSLEVPTRELREARSTIEQELGNIEVGVSALGGGGRQQGQLAGILDANRQQFELAEQRNVYLEELVDLAEEGAMGGGGGSGLLPFGAGALLGGGGGAGGGSALGSILGGVSATSIGGIAGIAAAGPLIGASIGFALRESGFGPKAQGVEPESGPMEPPTRPDGPDGGDGGDGQTRGRFDPTITTGAEQMDAPGFEPGERDWRFQTSFSAGDRSTTINVDASPNTEEIIREVERERRRDIDREIRQLRAELEKALGDDGSGRGGGGGGGTLRRTIQ